MEALRAPSINPYGLTCAEFCARLQEVFGLSPFYGRQAYRSLMKLACFPNISASHDSNRIKTVNQILQDSIKIIPPHIQLYPSDGALKFVTTLEDGNQIESVILTTPSGRSTLCVSSQVGCRMACLFCLTGNLGLHRNLSAQEIVSQLMTARFTLKLE